MASTMLSLRSVAGLAFALGSWSSGVAAGTPASCPSPQLSCQNANAASTCCFSAPGGQMLLTQFWDTSPSTGPVDSWTLHGLWPDNCDGTYEQYCDSAREYTGITGILKAAGKTDLLAYMDIYWKDYQGNDESFWQHEWEKHGTCINTLKPSCYTAYTAKEEAVDYFELTVNLFKGLDSYKALKAAGIVPSTSATYTTAAIQAALTAVNGRPVTIGCSKGELNEIWYHFNVLGSVPTGQFVAADPDGTKSTCPATGVKYLPKGGSAPPTTTTTTKANPPAPTGTGVFDGRGFLNVKTGSSSVGCIISAGTWYTTGTCATFTAAASGTGFTLTSSKGACGIVSGSFTCGASTAAAVFSANGGLLASSGSTGFFASSVPSGTIQATVYTSSSSAHSTALTISWQSV